VSGQIFIHFLISCSLTIVTVSVHAVGFYLLLRALFKAGALTKAGFRYVVRYIVGMACWVLLIHVVEIVVWGLTYFWLGCLPDARTACYFSAVTYTTLGYGDVVLPLQWRMLAPMEALTGILMCGLSTGLFFAIINVWIVKWVKRENLLDSHRPAPGN